MVNWCQTTCCPHSAISTKRESELYGTVYTTVISVHEYTLWSSIFLHQLEGTAFYALVSYRENNTNMQDLLLGWWGLVHHTLVLCVH
jgi:hypothetical protein